MMRVSMRHKAGVSVAAALLSIALAHAQAPAVEDTPAVDNTAAGKTASDKPSSAPTPAAGASSASLLAGKLRVTLPAGFERTALPPDGEHGAGAVYLDSARRQMVMVTEAPIAGGRRILDDDKTALDAVLDAHQAELDAPVSNYRRLGSQTLDVNGLTLRHTDGSTTFFDQRVYSSSLIAASGSRLATVMIMTPIDDAAAHQALVASILADLAAGR